MKAPLHLHIVQFFSIVQHSYRQYPASGLSVRRRVRVLRVSDAERSVPGIVYGVEPLEECISVDEIQALTELGTKIADYKVYRVRVASNGSIQLSDKKLIPRIYLSLTGYTLTARGQSWALGVSSNLVWKKSHIRGSYQKGM